MSVSVDRALYAAMAPIQAVPIYFSGTASTTPQLLVASPTGGQTRRIRVTNTGSTNGITVSFVRRGASIAGEVPTAGAPVSANMGVFDFVVTADLDVVVTSAAGSTYQGICSDV